MRMYLLALMLTEKLLSWSARTTSKPIKKSLTPSQRYLTYNFTSLSVATNYTFLVFLMTLQENNLSFSYLLEIARFHNELNTEPKALKRKPNLKHFKHSDLPILKGITFTNQSQKRRHCQSFSYLPSPQV